MKATNSVKYVVSGPSINILGLLGVAFVVLKLTGHITWSWWWVTAPFWGPWALALAIIGIVLCGLAGIAFIGFLAYLFTASSRDRSWARNRIDDSRNTLYRDPRPTVDEVHREMDEAEKNAEK